MKKSFIKSFFLLIASAVLISSSFAQAVLEPMVLAKVLDSVFEIVVDKIEDENIVYEKPLPMEKISYSIRTDKYIPIGTAFLMENGKFYTAAHVINLYNNSLYKNYYIRDARGQVFKIDEITEFSTNRDFVNFTVENFQLSDKQGLSECADIQMNTSVFSVGNALGEGIIIRNGLLTSSTFEEENGEWKWLRFSAAASPGNSGGPLINEKGEVLGIVTMKSPNENLNYALPLTEVKNSKPNCGVLHYQANYILPNIISYYHPFKIDQEFQLPKKLSELNKELSEYFYGECEKQVQIMRQDFGPDGAKSFSKVEKGEDFFFYSYRRNFPYLIYRNEQFDWDYATPSKTANYDLKEDGYITYGNILDYSFCFIQKPESVKVEDMINDGQIYMDYIVEAFNYYRNVGSEKVTVKSLGKPVQEEIYKDYFGRTWYINYYSLKFCDSVVVTYALPLPSGMFVMLKVDSTELVFGVNKLDMNFLADYIYPSYSGTIKEWTEFLSMDSSIIEKRADYEKAFKVELSENCFKSEIQGLKLDIPSSVLKLNENSIYYTSLVYSKIDDKTILKSTLCGLASDKDAKDFFSYFAKIQCAPTENASKDAKKSWEAKLNKKGSFKGKPYYDEDFLLVDKIIVPETEDGKTPDVIYYHSIELEGDKKPDEAKKLSSKLEKCISFN